MRMSIMENGQLVVLDTPDWSRWAAPSGASWCWLEMTVETFAGSAGQRVIDTMNLHRLAISDARKKRHSPKFEKFDDYALLILRESYASSAEREFMFAPLALFWDERRIVTVRHRSSQAVETLQAEVTAEPGRFPVAIDLASRLARLVCDGYMTNLLAAEQRLDDMEDELIETASDSFLHRALTESSMLKRMARSLRYQQIAVDEMYDELPGQTEHSMHVMQDALENMDRAATFSQMLAEIAVDMMNAFLSLHAHRLNRIMQVLTVLTAIFLPLTLIAGIYGMNFDNMPELHWHYGYFAVLGGMAVCVVLMVMVFKRLKWV